MSLARFARGFFHISKRCREDFVVRRKHSALYIDFNNIAGRLAGFGENIPGWLAWLEGGRFEPSYKRRRFTEKRAYLSAPYLHYAKAFTQAGFEVIPSHSDLLISLDIADSIHASRVQEYLLLTVDSDFDVVLERLGERGKIRVATVEQGYPCAQSFPPRTEMTIPLSNIKAAFSYVPRPGLGPRLRATTEQLGASMRAQLSRVRDGIRARRERAAGNRRLHAVAEEIAKLAHQTPGLPIGRRTVMKHLLAAFPELGAAPSFAGKSRYQSFLKQVVALRPDLELLRDPNGGVAVIAPRTAE